MRKLVEMIMALYGMYFGFYIVVQTNLGTAPLLWAGFDFEQSLMYGYLVSIAGVVHGAGVRINGRWYYSPWLRLVGMSTHALALAILMIIGIAAGSSAGGTYSFLFVLFVVGVCASVEDIVGGDYGRADRSTTG